MVEPNARWSAGFLGSVLHSPAASYARTIASVLILRTSGVVTAEVMMGRCVRAGRSGPAAARRPRRRRSHAHHGASSGDEQQRERDGEQLGAEHGTAP